jgi:hypothetical protein
MAEDETFWHEFEKQINRSRSKATRIALLSIQKWSNIGPGDLQHEIFIFSFFYHFFHSPHL